MKTLWNVLSILAVSHALAAAGVVAWMGATGRLSSERLTETRSIFAMSLADEEAADEAEAARLAEEAKQAEADRRMRVPPLSTESVIESQRDNTESMRQRLLRQQADLAAQREMLLEFQSALEERERKLKGEREAFETERRAIVELEASDQFKTALSTLEGQRPKDAADILRSMLDEGKRDVVIAYLDAMDDRPRQKIIAEVAKVESALAADLLERIRTRGLNAALGDGANVAVGSVDPEQSPPGPGLAP